MCEGKQTSSSDGISKRVMNFEDADQKHENVPWYFPTSGHPNHNFVAPNRSFHAVEGKSAR